MIEIEAPDGSIVEFPDTMQDADISKAMQRLYPKKEQAPPKYGKLESAIMGGGQGASLGFVDEATPLAVRLYAALHGDKVPSYDEALAETRNTFKEAREENPWSYGLGEVGGAVLSGIPAAKAASAIVKGGSVAKGAASGALPGAVKG